MQKITANNQPSTKKGFTLIELIIVITLLALFSTFGAINYVKLRERHLLENTAERIASELKSAKTASVNGTGSVSHGVIFAHDGSIKKTPTNTPISVPNGITKHKPNNGSISYELRTGIPNWGGAMNGQQFFILRSNSFQIQVDLDNQGNPILGKPMPLP